MTFYELMSRAGLECPRELWEREVSGIVTDSRKATKDCIFVCLRGNRYDGHDHIEQAIEAGAAVIVAEKVRGIREGGAALTFVNNTRLCASLLYNEWFFRPTDDLIIIGITGTNGKTSVTNMLNAIFSDAGYPCATVGTLGIYSRGKRLDSGELSVSNMTTPDPETLYGALAQMKSDGVRYVFMEVSSHALVQCRTDAIKFDCAVFTNLSEEHLDLHGDMESYYKAKEKLFLQSRRAVVNIDDPAGWRLFHSLQIDADYKKSCSTTAGDFCALLSDTSKVRYLLKTDEPKCAISLPNFSGSFQVMNSLEAAAVAQIYGIPLESVASSFYKMEGVKGRMERVVAHKKQNIDIFIDYAHTPDALERLLLSARAQKLDGNAKILLLFGCGGERDRGKRRIMGQIASRLADFVVITSDNSRGEDPNGIISDILSGIDKEKPYAVIPDRRSAIEKAIREYTNPGDLLLLAGKGHECYEIDREGVRAFDERCVVREALNRLYE
jgi:UDP-N-acetylmuramoyl-L-alanyl-D-glutamate--2,6-diaminopimelate ligase